MKRVKYAILKYLPNIERNETINLAIFLHSPSEKKIAMQMIDNWKRIKVFDDEADISFLKSYIKELEFNFTNNMTTLYDTSLLDDINLLDDITKFFVNKFIFELHIIDTDDNYSSLLKNLKNIYLYYEVPKSKRNYEEKSRREFEKNLLENNICYQRRNVKNAIQEQYGNNINFDYKIDNAYYKLIFLTEDNYNGYVSILKMWIANSMILKKENISLVFVVDDLMNNERTSYYKKMLADYGKLISIKDFVEIHSKNNF